MKTTILTIAILLVTVFGISQSTYAAAKNNEEAITLTDVNSINKIEVHGNVELYLSDGTTDKVKVYNNYYAESALVQNVNGVLRISSYTTQKLVVWVTVSDLRNLSVYDNAEVKSFGKLSSIDLGVQLYDRALAQLNLDTYQTSISLNGRAEADLSGAITEGELHYDRSASLNTNNLVATNLIKTMNFYHHGSELASL
jgi:Putative auto-transporter adhesin, head GIN domain